VDLRLLGPVELRLGDGPVELGPRKQRAVLAMLALRPGRTVPTDALIEGLWGEDPPASATKMLQLYVSHLRPLLGGNGAAIVTHGRGYALHLGDDEVDAARAERLVEQDRPRDALALWHGDTLEDVAEEPFAAPEIRRLEELRLRASESAIDADLAAGRHAEVIGELDALVRDHPLREHLHAQRMLALYRARRQSEALEAYREARSTLVEEVGVEPGAELRALHEQVLSQDPALDLAPPARAGASAPRPPPPRRRGLLLAAGALLLAGILAFGVIRVLEPDGLPGIEEDAVGLIDGDSGRITAQYAVGHGPQALAAGAGSVWVANRLDGTVSRIDRGRDEVVTIDVGGEPTGLAFGAGSLWVADGQGRTVAQIAPAANKVVRRIGVGNAAVAIAAGYGAVWVGSAVDATVVRIDARSGKPGRPIAVQARPSALAAGAGSIWVASDTTARVVRLDPRSGAPRASIHVGDGPSAVAVGAGAVWVANRGDGTISRIDPRSEVAETVRVGREPRALVTDRNGVWVGDGAAGKVIRLDRRGRRVTTQVDVGSSPAALAILGGTVWAATLAPAAAHRGGTLRVTSPPILPGVSGDFIDPDYLNPLVSVAYDGLVAYRRAGGAAGGTLVPDLAKELPEPGPDGRTYRFRLRSGVRFSDGAPVRPEDVRASIERMLQVHAREPGFSGYLPIRGASRCRATHCDLSGGVELDDAARSVTIHLSRRDVEFLHKLVNALVVPAGSPRTFVKTRALAGTGPYRVERWDPRRGGSLVRNPRFRVWSPDRPDGFPDRIVVRHDPVRAQLAAVDRGAVDLAWVDLHALGATQVRTRYGPRLHTDPIAETGYVFLNVHAAPFDDVAVRRALNFAVDRHRVAGLLGSSETQQPTCQLLPPGFQGYTPACPFTIDPNAAGTWTAPDLAHARRLVAASGTRGMAVEFWVSRGFAPVGRYFRSLLRRLGYDGRLRTFADVYPIAQHATRTRPQLGIWGWVADSAGPYNFMRPLVSCAGDTNLSRFCDPKLDAAMERAAVADGPEAIERWRRVEGRLAAQAPIVPLANAKDATVTAERVGNYQHHPLWGPLLDQMWVR
jgi:peptide/nickel transport system substrate-binding protein